MNEEKKPGGALKEMLDWVLSIVIAIAVALLLHNYVLLPVIVDGRSMDKTLSHGERLLVVRMFYEPEQGDIVILDPSKPIPSNFFERIGGSIKSILKVSPDTKYVKRVIATEGQTVEVVEEHGSYAVYVDGVKLNEPYAYESEDGTYITGTYEVGEDEVFVMGDNRKHSNDSRSIGPINKDQIVGKAVFRIWPLNSIGSIYGNE